MSDSEININIQIKINKHSIKTIAFFFLLFIMVIFLFVGGETQQKHRLIKDFWDAGHLALFGLISFAFFSKEKYKSLSVTHKLIITSVFCLIVGTAIEVLQALLSRGFSKEDILNDLIGGYLGLLALTFFNFSLPYKKRILALTSAVLLLVIGLRGMEKHLYDEIIMRQQFPVLADFENTLELERWEENLVNTFQSSRFVKTGKHSFAVEFLRGRYPNISLKHFPHDWSDYSHLVFSVYNPTDTNFKYELKIYDRNHSRNGRKFNDRFNKNIVITSGWNTFKTPLSKIKKSPKHRSMDLEKITGFSVFTDKLERPVTLYFDDIRLE